MANLDSKDAYMSVLQGPMRGPMGGSLVGGTRPAAVAGLPDPWLVTDIGSVGLAGSASYAGGTFTINGAGADIWGTADAFNFLYRSLSGNGTLTARIVTLDGWDFYEAAGLMVRETLDVGSKAVFAKLRYGSGFGLQFRDTTNDTYWTSDYDAYGAPYWMRIVRSDTSFSAYMSPDGSTWTQISTTMTLSMTTNVYIGMAICSHDAAVLGTATFDNVSLT